jgi:hypothetical protein
MLILAYWRVVFLVNGAGRHTQTRVQVELVRPPLPQPGQAAELDITNAAGTGSKLCATGSQVVDLDIQPVSSSITARWSLKPYIAPGICISIVMLSGAIL